jgi:hypothetical protein
MMFKSLFDEKALFRSAEEIKDSIKLSKNYEQENPSKAKLLTFFSTSNQKTYLVYTDKRVYCVLDDVRNTEPHINWSVSRDKIMKDNQLQIKLETRSKTDKTGLIDFGDKHKNWLYSKELFQNEDIVAEVEDFLTDED